MDNNHTFFRRSVLSKRLVLFFLSSKEICFHSNCSPPPSINRSCSFLFSVDLRRTQNFTKDHAFWCWKTSTASSVFEQCRPSEHPLDHKSLGIRWPCLCLCLRHCRYSLSSSLFSSLSLSRPSRRERCVRSLILCCCWNTVIAEEANKPEETPPRWLWSGRDGGPTRDSPAFKTALRRQWKELGEAKQTMVSLIGINAAVFVLWRFPPLHGFLRRQFTHSHDQAKVSTMVM